MASSSSSSSHFHQGRSDVFISSGGMDVRHGFLSHLTKALSRMFVDAYESFEYGDDISLEIDRAIEGSMISLVIFSRNYASSKWCLTELVKIMECHKVNNQIVIPVFYNVDPTDVRHQKGTYGDAFAKHEKKYFMDSMEKLQSWRSALNEAANLSGYHYSRNFQDESELINEIVKDVMKKLDVIIAPVESPRLVGFDGNIAHVESLLDMESQEVRIIGIWGKGGIGKTALVQAIYEKFSSKFDSCWFLRFREETQKFNGLGFLLGELYCQLLKEENLNIYDVEAKQSFNRRLSRKRVLIVLDDVYHIKRFAYRLEVQNHLGLGSRVIITSRDKFLLQQIGAHAIHEIGELNSKESLELFSFYAFNQWHPIRGYEELSKSAIMYVEGIPLALKVLGSKLHLINKEAWQNKLRKIKRQHPRGIHQVLRLSYNGLDVEEKNIFLDIAFFFREHPKADVIEILDACGFLATVGMQKLLDRYLITISDDNKIQMHDVLQEMGEQIVYEESSIYPGRRSRLNDLDDLYDVLGKNKGTDEVEGIILDLSKIRDVCLTPDTFGKMPNLRILMFFSSSLNKKRSNVKLPFGLESLPDNLRYFRWDGFPLMSLPSRFCAEKLVELLMEGSHVKFLWNGVQNLFNLKKVYLSESKLLIELPDFSRAPKLEMVDLSYCESLSSVHPSIFYLPRLDSLNLEGCKELRSLQSEIHLKPLTDLNFSNCFDLEDFSLSSQNVVLPNLTIMNLHGCKNLTVLPEFGGIPNLKRLDLEGCIGLLQLPQSLSICTKLEFLNLRNCTSLVSIPNSLFGFPRLEFLNLACCSKLAQCLDFDNWRSSLEVRKHSLFHYICDGNNKKFGFW